MSSLAFLWGLTFSQHSWCLNYTFFFSQANFSSRELYSWYYISLLKHQLLTLSLTQPKIGHHNVRWSWKLDHFFPFSFLFLLSSKYLHILVVSTLLDLQLDSKHSGLNTIFVISYLHSHSVFYHNLVFPGHTEKSCLSCTEYFCDIDASHISYKKSSGFFGSITMLVRI